MISPIKSSHHHYGKTRFWQWVTHLENTSTWSSYDGWPSLHIGTAPQASQAPLMHLVPPTHHLTRDGFKQYSHLIFLTPLVLIIGTIQPIHLYYKHYCCCALTTSRIYLFTGTHYCTLVCREIDDYLFIYFKSCQPWFGIRYAAERKHVACAAVLYPVVHLWSALHLRIAYKFYVLRWFGIRYAAERKHVACAAVLYPVVHLWSALHLLPLDNFRFGHRWLQNK
jgi:hypothetical protein